MKILCKYGSSIYYLFDDRSVRCGSFPGVAKIIYSQTPIKQGYREFMPKVLYDAMEKERLIKPNDS